MPRLRFLSPKLKVIDSDREGAGVIAAATIKAGDLIIDLDAEIVHALGDYTMRTGESTYLRAEFIDNFFNHSCEPNTRIMLYPDEPQRVSYVAIRDIAEGEEILWNYNTTEWDFEEGFDCKCGTASCIGFVQGMRFAPADHRKRILHLCTQYIKDRLAGYLP